MKQSQGRFVKRKRRVNKEQNPSDTKPCTPFQSARLLICGTGKYLVLDLASVFQVC
jgi:hypothetical protein